MWSFCFHCPYEIFLDLPPTEQRKSIAAQVRTPLPTHLYSLLDIFLHFCYILVYILVYLFVCVACAWIHKCDSMLTEIRWQPAGVDATMWVLGIQLSCSRLVASALVYWVSTLASTSLFCLLFYLFYISSSHSWPCIPDPSALPPEWGNYGYATTTPAFPGHILFGVSSCLGALTPYGSPHHRAVSCPLVPDQNKVAVSRDALQSSTYATNTQRFQFRDARGAIKTLT